MGSNSNYKSAMKDEETTEIPMKKTIEIPVTLREDVRTGSYKVVENLELKNQRTSIVAKLVVELPEQKHEVSESQLKVAITELRKGLSDEAFMRLLGFTK